MTVRLTGFTDTTLTKTDMCVKFSKTYNQYLQPLQQVYTITDGEGEVIKKIQNYNHVWEFVKADSKPSPELDSCIMN